MRHADFALASGFASRLFVPPPIPTITTTTVPNGQVGTAYLTNLTATGGTPPYLWSITSGSLPAGLSIVGQTIQGTPTVAGSSSFTLLVTDALAQTDVQAISLTVGSAPPPPQPTISTTSLPAGTVGTAYSAALQATSGTLPYTWVVASGVLPAGLSLSQGSGGLLNQGIVSGTPTTAGTATVGFQVTDGLAQHATKTLNLTVNAKTINPLPQTIPFGSPPSTTNLGTETLQPGAESPPYPINWNAQGQFVTTPFSCPAGLTQFTIRYSAAVAASRQISLDGTVIFGNLSFPATGNFQTWSTVSFTRTLAAGDHSMTMLFDVPSGSHDFINPDNLKLTVGSLSGIFTIPSAYAWSASNTADQTVNIQNFVTSISSGTTSQRNTIQAVFGQRYRIEGTVYLGSAKNPTVTSKHDLNFDLNGAEFFCTVPNPYGVEAASVIATNRFNYANHGLGTAAPIRITGGLKNTHGISSGVTYWPVNITTGSFQLATSPLGNPLDLTGTADTQINMRNAPAPNLRAFLFSTDFPGNDNFDRIMFSAEGCTNIRFTDSAGGGQITGAQTNGPMGTYDARYEAQAGISVFGGTNIEIDNLDIRSTLGDGVAVLGSTTYGQPTFVNIHDNNISGTGRHGISLGNGGATDCTIAYNSIVGAPRHIIDFEDDNVGTTKPLRRNTIKGNYCHLGNNPGPSNLNLWLAMGGESLNMGDIVVGGLLGHPLDGNLIVGGVMQDDVRNATTGKATTRRGPYTFGYNVGGGQIQLTTHQGQTTATYTGLVNNTRFTDTQLLQFQSISGSTLPVPCQINGVNETTRTVTLSHPASSGGTQTITATFGAQFGKAAPSGALDFQHIDGANCFWNTIVVQASSNAAGSIYDACSGINDHDNIVYGGSDSVIVNPITVGVGGHAAIRAAIGQSQDTGHFWTSQQNRWNNNYTPVGTVNPFRWNNTYSHPELANPAGTTDSAGFGYVGAPRCLIRQRGDAGLVNIANGNDDATWTNLGVWAQQLTINQGNVPQVCRLLLEFDGDWFTAWSARTNGALLFNRAFNHAAGLVHARCPTIKFALCGDLGYTGASVGDTSDFSLWDQVMDGVSGEPGIKSRISVSDTDTYSNGGPTGPAPWIQNALINWKNWAIGRGLQLGHGEWGIGLYPTAGGNFFYSPKAWADLYLSFWAGLPASGPGSLLYINLFDEGQIDASVDYRGVSFVTSTYPGTSGQDGTNVANELKAGWQ